MIAQDKDGKSYCTENTSSCTTCGNGVCDAGESKISCPSDCTAAQDYPEVLYSSTAPSTKTPVYVSLYLPVDAGCKVLNNNGQTSYKFTYNGSFIFQVMCPRFTQQMDMVAKVYRLPTDTIVPINVNDLSSSAS